MNIMTPQQIKQAIEDAGYTQSGLARDLNVSPGHFGMVLHGKAVSHRVRCHIAKAIGRPVDEVFEIKENPIRTGRPMGRGLYDHRNRQGATA